MRRGLVGILLLLFGAIGIQECAMAQIRIIPQESLEEAANPSTIGEEVMLFEEGTKVSFGTIGEDSEPWHTTLHWRNSVEGRRITITQVKTSCGCLVAEWDKRQSINASEGTLTVTYHPKGHAGEVAQRIFVYTTLSESKPTAIVECFGKVEPSADHTSRYPLLMGTLGLRNRTVTLPAEGGAMEIAVMNCGSEPLRVTHDVRMSVGGVGAYTLPHVLQPGEEGVLVVEYKPEGNTPPMLFLEGVNIPPRERKIEIEIEK